MAILHSPVPYQQTLAYNTSSFFCFIIPCPSFSMELLLHPFILLLAAFPLILPLQLLLVGAIFYAQSTAIHPSPSLSLDLCDSHRWPQGWKEGTVSQQGAHPPALVSAASGSQPAFIGFLNCICFLTAFACLHSSLLVLTHRENEGVNTLTWVITLRLLFFFLSFPSSSPQNKRINSKRIKKYRPVQGTGKSPTQMNANSCQF